MKIWMSPEAEQDLIEIFDYNPVAAAATLETIEKEVNHLASLTHLGRVGRVPKTRELVLASAPYVIPYQVRKGRLEILRIYHALRRWPEDF